MGKTRLVERLAEMAEEAGCKAHYGHCWEAGGAPALWPWIEATRSLLRAAGEGPAARLPPRLRQRLAPLLPELSAPADPGEESLEPEQARYQLMDALSLLISEAATEAPGVIILEDLHAGDASSVALLRFLLATVRNAPLLLVGTLRPSEAASPSHADLLALCRADGAIHLQPLDRQAVEAYFRGVVDGGREDAESQADRDRLYELTEGHPLFMAEMMRLREQLGRLPEVEALPRSLLTAIDERLDRLPEEVRRTLRVAAVLGREVRTPALSALLEEGPDLTEAASRSLREATRAGILLPLAEGHFRFAHILLREALYQRLTSTERAELHGKRARELSVRARQEPSAWFEAAHHFLESHAVEETLVALERAAQVALERLAFDEAVALLERALGAARLRERQEPTFVVELSLRLAQALLQAGRVVEGRELCHRVADRARALRDAQLACRAALLCGSVYVFAHVDPKLVEILEMAQSLLAPSDVAQRAEVKARLAAALQPSQFPARPIALAREAIAEARSVGDPSLLLRVIRSACSAMMDLTDPAERRALNEEYIRLADALDSNAEAFRGYCRLTLDCFELGELARVRGLISEMERRAARIDHPFYLWRARSFRAAEATYSGRFAEAESQWREAERLGARSRDPNAQRAVASGRVRLARARGEESQLPHLALDVEAAFQDEPFGRLLSCGPLAQAGARQELRARFKTSDLQLSFDVGDLQALTEALWVADALGDGALLRKIREQALPHAGRFVSGGMTGMTFDPPAMHIVARAAHFLGDAEEAAEYYDRTLAELDRTQGWPDLIQHALHFGKLRREFRLSAGHAARCSHWLRVAKPIADQLGLARASVMLGELCREGDAARQAEAASTPVSEPPCQQAGSAPLTEAAAAAGEPAPARLRKEGDLFRAEYRGESIHLGGTKGMALLSQLVEQPNREIHVLDLVSPGAVIDRGQAGPTLDDTARRQYRQRLEQLRAELDEAEGEADPGRAHRARAELEMLERELRAAFGMGGRARPRGSAAERARVNVQRRIKDALKRIAERDPALGKHLEASVRTGTFCSYRPRVPT